MCRSIDEGGRRCAGACGADRNAADRARYAAAKRGSVRVYKKRSAPATPPPGVRIEGQWVTGVAADLRSAQVLAAIEDTYQDERGRVSPGAMPKAVLAEWERLGGQDRRMVDIPVGLVTAAGLMARGAHQALGRERSAQLRQLLVRAFPRSR